MQDLDPEKGDDLSRFRQRKFHSAKVIKKQAKTKSIPGAFRRQIIDQSLHKEDYYWNNGLWKNRLNYLTMLQAK